MDPVIFLYFILKVVVFETGRIEPCIGALEGSRLAAVWSTAASGGPAQMPGRIAMWHFAPN